MAASTHYISLTCILLLVMQPMVAGLKCYVCTSCTSPTNLQTVMDGAAGYSCWKNAVMAGGSASVVSRGYLLSSACIESNAVIAGSGIINTCCTTDGCNGSIAVSSSLIFTIGIAAVASLIKNIMVN